MSYLFHEIVYSGFFFCCDKFDTDNRQISIVKLHNMFHTFMSTVVNDSKFVQHFFIFTVANIAILVYI